MPIEHTGRENPFSKYFYHYSFGGMFAILPAVTNYYTRRPVYSGIQRHVMWAIFGVAVGHYIDRYFNNKFIERDAIIRHYVELHPEDFKVEKKKFKEIFEEWYPVR